MAKKGHEVKAKLLVDKIEMLIGENQDELGGWLSILGSQHFYDNVMKDIADKVLKQEDVSQQYSDATHTLLKHVGIDSGLMMTLAYRLGAHMVNAICVPTVKEDDNPDNLPHLMVYHIEINETQAFLSQYNISMLHDFGGIQQLNSKDEQKE